MNVPLISEQAYRSSRICIQFYAVFVFISVHVTCFILKGFILDPNLFLPIINTHNKKKHPMRNSAGCFFPYIKYSLPLKRPQVEELPYDQSFAPWPGVFFQQYVVHFYIYLFYLSAHRASTNIYYFFEICNHIIVLLEVLTNIKRI